jgi:hypothetical protein
MGDTSDQHKERRLNTDLHQRTDKPDAHLVAQTEASENLLTSVRASIARNGGDDTTNQSWLKKDEKVKSAANGTADLATALRDSLDPEKGHKDFSDPKVQTQAKQLIAQMRAGRDLYDDERKSAASFHGKDGLPPVVRNLIGTDAHSIAASAKELLKPHTSENRQTELLDSIATRAREINQYAKKGDQTSSDVRDMAADSDQIMKTVTALRSPDLTPAERKTLYQSIASKGNSMIPNSLEDLRLEGKEMIHNSAAIKDGATLEAQLRYAIAHPGAQKALGQVRDSLDNVSTDLNRVAGDNRTDEKLEKRYSLDDADDTRINNRVLAIMAHHKTLHFPNIFDKHK